ncbi:MAG: hypothetical protein K6U87_11175 [Firmicutes bacterium]|nr:hypothetical protein [Bacillota bacterium]
MHIPETFQAPRSLRDWWRGVRRPPAERAARQAPAADPPPSPPAPSVTRPEPLTEAAGWRRLVRWVRRLPPGAPVTVNAVARAMRCSRWDAWRWCHALEAAGEVESVALPPDRRGRPRRLWRRPQAGGPGHG